MKIWDALRARIEERAKDHRLLAEHIRLTPLIDDMNAYIEDMQRKELEWVLWQMNELETELLPYMVPTRPLSYMLPTWLLPQ